MGHGTPDWWGQAPKSTTYALGDMAELAVRLGGISTFDRRGDVLWEDNFANGAADVTVFEDGTDSLVYPVVGGGFSHGIGLCMVTGSIQGDYAMITKKLFFPALGGLGLEIAFSVPQNVKSIRCGIDVYDGTNVTYYAVRYLHTTGQVQVYTTAGGWETIGTPGIEPEGVECRNMIKLVLDTLAGTYVRARYNSHDYDPSAVPPLVVQDSTKPYIVANVMVTNNVEAAVAVAIDNVIVTQNEPV